MSEPKLKILVFVDWFLPGYRAGGPIRSIANMVDGLSEHCDFSIVCGDRDFGAEEPYEGVERDTWVQRSPHCRVWYMSPEARSYRRFRTLIEETDYDLLYLNSMFSKQFTIYALWNSRSQKPERPVVLAPRGMLHAGALSLKSRKKKLFLGFMKLIGIHKQIFFQATDAQEASDIAAAFGPAARSLSAGNLPRMLHPGFQPPAKEAGQLRIIFLSRISEKKGVHSLIAALQGQTAAVELNIYGPDEEPGYWERCEAVIRTLPPQVQVRKYPPVPPQETAALIQSHDCFAMPTLGENYGHAIYEALCAGRPVLISDQTPWRGLAARHAGHDLPLERPEAFAQVIREWAAMDAAAFEPWARGAAALAREHRDASTAAQDTLAMFREAIRQTDEEVALHGVPD